MVWLPPHAMNGQHKVRLFYGWRVLKRHPQSHKGMKTGYMILTVRTLFGDRELTVPMAAYRAFTEVIDS